MPDESSVVHLFSSMKVGCEKMSPSMSVSLGKEASIKVNGIQFSVTVTKSDN